MQKLNKTAELLENCQFLISRLSFWAILATIVLASCNDPNDLGMELLPSADLISINTVEQKEGILAFTHQEEVIRTDEASKSLLGVIDDPVFGRTTINFATQFYLQTFPDFGTNTVADSVFLYLYYRLIYGDTITSQRFKVYELTEPLYSDSTTSGGASYDYPYYQNVDLKSMASPELLGELDFTPRVRQDSASQDTFYQLITIPLDISLAEKLVNADSTDMVSNEAFSEYFKGLYIESEKESSEGGTILKLEPLTDGNFQGSALVVYYNNDENINGDQDTLYTPYVVTASSARVNSIEHDYTGTPFYDKLNTSSDPDSLVYIQATGGLESRIEIENLTSWQDSVNSAINRVEIIFQIDTLISDVEKYPPPNQLFFVFLDSIDNVRLPVDYLSEEFYGGDLDTDNYTYRFNITEHIQRISDGIIENKGFYLTIPPNLKNSQANRVVLKGTESDAGIRMNITYSKYSQ